MPCSKLPLSLLTVAFVLGCGGSPPPPPAEPEAPKETADDSKPAEEAAPEGPKQEGVPTACESDEGGVCSMPERFARKLCNGFFPDLALHLFSQERWTKAYVNIKQADAWNALGGSASDAKLVFDEEVLIVNVRKPKDLGGMQVSGNGASYDFIRWDGTCASLQVAEMTLRKPPKPKNAAIPWRSLDDETKAALQSDEKFAQIAATRKKECRGATIGEVTDKCEKADKALNAAIADAIRKGASVPLPKKLP